MTEQRPAVDGHLARNTRQRDTDGYVRLSESLFFGETHVLTSLPLGSIIGDDASVGSHLGSNVRTHGDSWRRQVGPRALAAPKLAMRTATTPPGCALDTSTHHAVSRPLAGATATPVVTSCSSGRERGFADLVHGACAMR